VINAALNANRVEQQGYKTCMSILMLSEQYSALRLEAACGKALAYTPRPGYKQILSILSSGQDRIAGSTTTPTPSQHSFVRGADYYTGGKK